MRFKLDFNKLFGKTAGWFFARGLQNPRFFHGTARRVLEGHSNNNLPIARQLAIQSLWEYLDVVEACSPLFIDNYKERFTYDTVKFDFDGKKISRIGSGVGLDTDGEGLYPMSRIYGFQITGPVFVEPSEYATIYFADDHRNHNLYLQPTTSSRGVIQYYDNLKAYRQKKGDAVIFAALGGQHPEENNPHTFDKGLKTLAQYLSPLVDGFIWCPLQSGFSKDHPLDPDTAGEAAKIIRMGCPQKTKILLEIPPYEAENKENTLNLASAFLQNGGNGFLTVGIHQIERAHIAVSEWPFETAYQSGLSLTPYRRRAESDLRAAFPDSLIISCGGIHDREEIWRSMKFADLCAENEAFTRYGPGLIPVFQQKMVLRLNYLEKTGQRTSNLLDDYQRSNWEIYRKKQI